MFTNKGLVEFVMKALAEGWGYVWGTFGLKLTDSYLANKVNQYPSEVGGKLDFIKAHWLNKITVDCVGLIKAYYWTVNGTVAYDVNTDVSADGMYQRATKKGTIDTLPEVPGICLWKPGHIGVYIGGGKVIEARGTYYGVIESSLTDNNPGWTNWLECPFISYEAPAPQPAPVVHTWDNYITGDASKKLQNALNTLGYRDNSGSTLQVDGFLGDLSLEAMSHVAMRAHVKNVLVQAVQERLIALGYNLPKFGADGDMTSGGETETAVKAFQSDRHLVVDGIIGINTLKALYKR